MENKHSPSLDFSQIIIKKFTLGLVLAQLIVVFHLWRKQPSKSRGTWRGHNKRGCVQTAAGATTPLGLWTFLFSICPICNYSYQPSLSRAKPLPLVFLFLWELIESGIWRSCKVLRAQRILLPITADKSGHSDRAGHCGISSGSRQRVTNALIKSFTSKDSFCLSVFPFLAWVCKYHWSGH